MHSILLMQVNLIWTDRYKGARSHVRRKLDKAFSINNTCNNELKDHFNERVGIIASRTVYWKLDAVYLYFQEANAFWNLSCSGCSVVAARVIICVPRRSDSYIRGRTFVSVWRWADRRCRPSAAYGYKKSRAQRPPATHASDTKAKSVCLSGQSQERMECMNYLNNVVKNAFECPNDVESQILIAYNLDLTLSLICCCCWGNVQPLSIVIPSIYLSVLTGINSPIYVIMGVGSRRSVLY